MNISHKYFIWWKNDERMIYVDFNGKCKLSVEIKELKRL